MNEKQRKLLIAIGVIVLGMLLYPPYRIYGAGSHSSTIREAGYAWLFNLPGRATVDIATLAVQWLGVLIVGGIAYFILNPSSRVAQLRPASAADSEMVAQGEKSLNSSDAGTSEPLSNSELYKAYLGEKNQNYYLKKFEEFDRLGDGMHISWSWPAFLTFLFGATWWALYRKLYAWFFALLVYGAILLAMTNSRIDAIATFAFVLLVPSTTAVGMFANVIYYRRVKAKIAAAQNIARSDDELIALLRKKGGIHSWVWWILWVWLAVAVIGIIAAIAISAYSDYAKKAQASSSVPLPQKTDLMSIESSGLEADPAHENQITLNALLRNRASYPQAFPNLELTLNDTQGKPLVRRIFKPKDYLPPQENEQAGLLSNHELNVKLNLDTADLRPTGYRLELFYPQQ